ncbi:hypothetical protein M422DRAFT_245462 [Sphaerobolus stellatus SS14]|nr:hypothetical protein M422DRAFT_245462 [Sphaerobolus stellatus SS14]
MTASSSLGLNSPFVVVQGRAALRSWKTPPVPTNVTEFIGFKPPAWNNLNDESEKLKATWLGHACLLVELLTPPGIARGPRILFDPVFSHRCGPTSCLGPSRITPPACPVQQLPEVDAIVISHCQYDHLDIPTIKSVVFPPSKPTSIALLTHVFAPLKNEDLFQSLSIPSSNYHCLDWWLNRDVTVHLLAAPSTSESESAIKKSLPTACGTPSPPSPKRRSPLSPSPPIFKSASAWFLSVIQSILKEVLYPSSSPTWTTSSSSIHLYTARSGIFSDAFACPTTMITTVTTTVIKDEASIKVDESLLLPYSFGGTLNDAEMDAVGLGRTMASLASIQSRKKIGEGSFGVVFEGNQSLDGAPHIVLSLELQLSPTCTTSPKGLHNALVINLFDMCDNKYIR